MTGSFFGGVHDFFHSGTWVALETLALLLACLFWVATVFWVRKDARRRIAERPLVWLATAVGAVPPFLGPLLYMLFRPPEYLADVRERELEIRAIERRLGEREEECRVCGADVEPDFLVCPVCTTRLRQACAGCGRPLEPAWQVCPYCETAVAAEPVPLPAAPTRRSRSRRTTTSTSG